MPRCGDGYKNQYTGFELSVQGQLDGGGSVFGGWSADTPGTSWFSGGLLDACSIRTAEDDDPNSLRFCDTFSYPTPYRHEFKVSGNYPLPWYDLMVAGTVIANAGGYAGDTLAETIDLGGRVRWEVRAEGFNLSNAGFERGTRSTRGTSVGRQSGIFEYASVINNGRILRLSTTARW